MPPSGPLHSATPRCVVVVGMHRSGTSLAAGLLVEWGSEKVNAYIEAAVAGKK